ncbi:MAG: excinuclease ABC subunit UvrA [Isosphaeraceae bacterium]
MDEAQAIRVRGARVHNLRDIDVEIPRDRLVVLTGVSGSGKSTLAFDTLYAEGRRRYLEGLSSYARQFLDQLERPDVDLIEGLPPTVAIDQKTGSANPRSTVATVTEIHDYLRLLYARAGIPHCPICGQVIHRQTPEQMISGVLALQEGRKVIIMAPIVRGRKGQHTDAFAAIRRAQLLRARVDGQIVELGDEPLKLAKTKVHTIEAVVDRLVVRDGIRPRLAESLDLALKLGEGTVILSVQTETGWDDRVLSIHYACNACSTGFEALEPRTFSFNSPYGACKTCGGLGARPVFDPELVIPDHSRSIDQEAVAPWLVVPAARGKALAEDPALSAFLKRHALTRQAPLASWPAEALGQFLNGDKISKYKGLIHLLDAEYQRSKTDRQRAALGTFRGEVVCPDCQGARLRPEARAVTVGGRTLPEVSALPVGQARAFLDGLRFEPPLDLVGRPLVLEIVGRLDYLLKVGLGYLTLARGADTLSGGELQRVRLATQIGSGLVGVCFLLDEPTAGLHPRDTDRLLTSLTDLRDQGNSVVVVEHDESVIRAADWMIDLGPGAGPEGGRVVAFGPPDRLVDSGESLTARYLRGEVQVAADALDRPPLGPAWLTIKGARAHNLKGVTTRVPVGSLTCVTGVSGSGKSTLVQDVLVRAVRRQLEGVGPKPGLYARIDGVDALDKLIAIDQTPIGRSPRSTPATYANVYDEIRRLYAHTRTSKIRGYKASRFSFNVAGGRCEVCAGQGMRRIEMQFLPDLSVPCEACGGQRFNRPTLEARYKGKSIGDVLGLRVDEALTLFDAVPRVRRPLESLHEAGLGYVTLGQSSTTLSGGEAQRVKLAAELGRPATGKTLYILDEPTTGLHFADVSNLLRVLRRLVDLGNTVVVIEHNLDLIRAADWLIDLGPEGGDLGGQIVAMGTPDQVAKVAESHTGRYLSQP